MYTDLTKARTMLEDGNVTCALCKGSTVYTLTQHGIAPVLALLEAGTDLKNFSVADKVVGKAAAMLYCLMGVRVVYGRVMSDSARQVLLDHGITAQWEQHAETIRNRDNTGICPLEQAMENVDTPARALTVIRETLHKLQDSR